MQTLNQSLMNLVQSNPWIIALLVWSVVWKLIALWKSARNDHLTMFVIMAVVNSAGVLEICYLIWLYFRNKKTGNPAQQ